MLIIYKIKNMKTWENKIWTFISYLSTIITNKSFLFRSWTFLMTPILTFDPFFSVMIFREFPFHCIHSSSCVWASFCLIISRFDSFSGFESFPFFGGIFEEVSLWRVFQSPLVRRSRDKFSWASGSSSVWSGSFQFWDGRYVFGKFEFV